MRPTRSRLVSGVRFATGYLCLAGLIVLSGCGKGKIARYPVTGSVLIDDKPAAGAMVIFCPVEGAASDEAMKLRPFGFTGDDGKFTLTTLERADGSPAGEYKVLIQWPSKSGGDSRDGGVALGPDRLRGRYMNLAKTQLMAKIENGPAELPPFKLTSK